MKRSSIAAVAILLASVWLPATSRALSITEVIPAHESTKGGKTLTINGVAFATSGNSVSVGGSNCAITSESATSIECTLPEGRGAFQPLTVADGTGTTSPPFAFGHDAPEVTDVTPTAANTRGGTLLTIIGSNFGPFGARSVHVGGVDCPVLLTPPGASPHDQVLCMAPPGQGTSLAVVVDADGQQSGDLTTVSYQPPSVTDIAPTHAAAIGGVRLTIYGDQFGLASTVSVGGNDCPVAVQSQTRLECTVPPGSGTNVDVRVSTGGQSSNALPFSYATPVSKCDAAKSKASGDFAKCLAGVQAKAAKKGVGTDTAAIAKCEEKIDNACAKAESSAGDCSQPGTCDALKQGTNDWDGVIYGNVR